MRRQIRGKRILITGASSGIGRAMAIASGKRGARLILAARSLNRLGQLAEDLHEKGIEAVPIVSDVTRDEDRQAMFRKAIDELGGLDILVNNAGIGAFGHFVDLSPDILRQTMEVNFFAMAESCRLAVPILADGSQPLIVNVSSRAGRRGIPAWTDYSASKFAVSGFSEALRAELVRFNIDLLLVVPGLVTSEFSNNLLARKGRFPLPTHGLSADVAADRILRAMERNKKELRMEWGARMILFLNWLVPRFLDRQMARVVSRLYSDEILKRSLGKAKSRPRMN